MAMIPFMLRGSPVSLDPMIPVRMNMASALANVGSIKCFVVSPRFSIARNAGGKATLVKNW